MKKFIKIIARYEPDEIVTYEKYIGKPYYAIMYEENGMEHVGFGTYDIDVLSKYLKEYFISEEPKMTPETKGEGVMIIKPEDFKMLLDMATETGRDLSLTFNADGTYEVSFNRPAKYVTTTIAGLKEEECKAGAAAPGNSSGGEAASQAAGEGKE